MSRCAALVGRCALVVAVCSSALPAPAANGMALDYWSYTTFPYMSDSDVQAYCTKAPEQWEQYYRDKNEEAQGISDRLERHIRAWLAGKAPALLPPGLLPPSIDNEKTTKWTLKRSWEVKAKDQWYWRPANEIPEDFSRLYFLGPDNHVTYMKTLFVAPFGSQLLVEGDFPRARFMAYNILGPFDPRNPTTSDSGLGAPEVPIVDVDINPDPGHINPFRPGANRNAKKRHYHLTFDLMKGNAAALNPQAMIAPAYRGPGNRRVGGPFGSSGPYGDGQTIASTLWLRYYAPDRAAGPFGGVPLPKLLLRLKTGETFWLQPDLSLVNQRANTLVKGVVTWPAEPPEILGPNLGWAKIFGFWLAYAEGIGYQMASPAGSLPKEWVGDYIVASDRCLFGRGPDMPPPGNHEASATSNSYASYLFRVVSLGEGKAYALTGKLPVTPKTRMGERIATTGEARYWSLCHTGNGEWNQYQLLLYGCLMDDEVKTNQDGRYVIVYTRGQDRPANARPECGVTWQDFGLESQQSLLLRWLSVQPDDYLPEHAPDLNNIPWETGAWSQPTWDQGLVGTNTQNGVMGPYQPLIHYLTKSEFEQLGCPVDPAAVPLWTDSK